MNFLLRRGHLLRCLRCKEPVEGVRQFCDACEEESRAAGTFTAPPPETASLCPSCGNFRPPDVAVCPACGHTSGELVYAGFWLRFMALIVDTLVLLIPAVIVSLLVRNLAANVAVYQAIALVYTVGFWMAEGATPGKMALSLRIVTTAGGPLTLRHALLRYVGRIVSSLILAGHIIIAFTPKKQALHDYLGSTVVIRTG